jgi:hypothetical protein
MARSNAWRAGHDRAWHLLKHHLAQVCVSVDREGSLLTIMKISRGEQAMQSRCLGRCLNSQHSELLHPPCVEQTSPSPSLALTNLEPKLVGGFAKPL